MRCVNCGTELADDARFCYACGAEQPAEEQAVNIVADNVRICPFCGAQNDPDAKYCEECGKDMDSVFAQNSGLEGAEEMSNTEEKEAVKPEEYSYEAAVNQDMAENSNNETQDENMSKENEGESSRTDTTFCPFCGAENEDAAVFCEKFYGVLYTNTSKVH